MRWVLRASPERASSESDIWAQTWRSQEQRLWVSEELAWGRVISQSRLSLWWWMETTGEREGLGARMVTVKKVLCLSMLAQAILAPLSGKRRWIL
jgi:hypothetical protein